MRFAAQLDRALSETTRKPAPALDGAGTAPLRAVAEDPPPWLAEAEAVRDGTTRATDGRALVRLAGALDRATPFVPLPWCGLFVAHCLRATRPHLRLPRRQAQARPWLGFGAPTRPELGAILVFWAVARRSPFGHVGFHAGEDADCFHVLGGNQRDRVIVERWPKTRLLGARWPDPAVPRTGRRPRRAPDRAAPAESSRLP